jgi:hypothetical protein
LSRGGGGEAAEGGGEAIELGRALLGIHVVIEEAGFNGEGAAEAPGGGDHLFDEAELDFVVGREAGDGAVEE